MSGNRRFQKNAVSNQSAQEASLRLKNKGKNQMVGASGSAPYPYRPGEPDCYYYLRTGSCGYGSNCRYNHPVYDAQGGQYREELPGRIKQPNCVYFLNGTCKYGSTCKFRHPRDINGDGPVTSSILGLSMRQRDGKSCMHYMRTGSCKFGVTCKLLHPQPTSFGAGLPANGPVGSSFLPRSGVRRVPYSSGCRLQTQSYMPVVSSQNTIPAHGGSTSVMGEEQNEFRGWDELIPEALGLIFNGLSLEELLTVIPCVCKSWRNVVTGPYCWQEIDIEQWSTCSIPRHVDRMLRMLVPRSSGSLRKLCVSGIENDSIFSFITKNAGSLQALRLPGSEMRDSVVEQTAKRLSTITLLDLSDCSRIGSRALEAIGKHCKLLVTLYRNIEATDLEVDEPTDAEANAIAATMSRLKHLEMAYHDISTGGVMNILSGCPQLEFLNIKGCYDVELDYEFLKEKFPKLKVLGPNDMEDFDEREWLECSDYTDSDYDPWDPAYLDYDDYTDPFHPDQYQDDDYDFF